jgi:hypothetical protein
VHATLADLSGRALRFVRAREITGGEEVLAELAHLHPVEQVVGLENALTRWVDDPAASALHGVLPELRAYCEHRVEELQAAAAAAWRRARQRVPALPAYGGDADGGDAGDDAGDDAAAAGGEGDFFDADGEAGLDEDDFDVAEQFDLRHAFQTLLGAIPVVMSSPRP